MTEAAKGAHWQWVLAARHWELKYSWQSLVPSELNAFDQLYFQHKYGTRVIQTRNSTTTQNTHTVLGQSDRCVYCVHTKSSWIKYIQAQIDARSVRNAQAFKIGNKSGASGEPNRGGMASNLAPSCLISLLSVIINSDVRYITNRMHTKYVLLYSNRINALL